MVTKQCSKCNETKSINEFNKGISYKDGYRSQCKQCIQILRREYCSRPEVKEHHRNRMREYMNKYLLNPDAKDRVYKRNRKYRLTSKAREKKREHYKNNLNYRLSQNMAHAINKSLKGNKNGRHWESIVGYTLTNLKNHLEKQFQPGMTWKNHGEWHIDHKNPISAFNFTSYKNLDFSRCWALSNLQPLWARDNLTKHSKLDNFFQPSFAF